MQHQSSTVFAQLGVRAFFLEIVVASYEAKKYQ
jgi:hypothetical protein